MFIEILEFGAFLFFYLGACINVGFLILGIFKPPYYVGWCQNFKAS